MTNYKNILLRLLSLSLSHSLYLSPKSKMVDPLSVLIGVIQKYYVLHRKCGKTFKTIIFVTLKLGGVTETKNMYPKSCRIMLCYKWTLYFRILWYFFFFHLDVTKSIAIFTTMFTQLDKKKFCAFLTFLAIVACVLIGFK